MATVYVNVNITLLMVVDDGIDINTVMEDIDHSFKSKMKEVYIENSEIENWTYRDVYSK
jgi:hypothetical protein